MAPETLTANAFDLLSNPYCVPDLSSLLAAPGKRTSNVTVAQRHGAVRTPVKRYDVNQIPLELWIKGTLPDGSIPTSRQELFYANVDALQEVFAADTVLLTHGLPDGTTRLIDTEVLDALDFTRFPHRRGALGKLVVVLEAWDPFWRAAADTTDTAVSTSGALQTETLSNFDGATAPMEALLITLAGPAINPIITCGPYWARYAATIPGGQAVVINTATWTLTGTGGLVPDYTKLTHAGLGPWFALQPRAGGPVVTYDHTGVTTSTATFVGRRRYLGG